MKKIRKILFLVVLTFFVSNVFGGEASLVLGKLAQIINQPIPYSVLREELVINGQQPFVIQSIEYWNKHFPHNKLTCVYVADCADNIIDVNDKKIHYGSYYLWVGIDKDETEETGVLTYRICRPQEHSIYLFEYYTTLDNAPKIEKLTPKQFVQRTFALYEVDLNPAI